MGWEPMQGGDGINVQGTAGGFSVDSIKQEFFIARITGAAGSYASGSGDGYGCGPAHSWEEIVPASASCGYERQGIGRRGSATENPAFELNGRTCRTGTLVFMRERGIGVEAAGTLYDFMAPDGTSSATGSGSGSGSGTQTIAVVTNVCLVASGSGSGS